MHNPPLNTVYRIGFALLATLLLAGEAEAQDTVRDEFNSVSYGNNNGTTNWSASWVEDDDDGGGASSGLIRVTGNRLRIRAKKKDDDIYRQHNLSGAVTATLSFDVDNDLDGDDEVRVEVSGNGGSSWNTLKNFTSSNNGSGNESFDISSEIASNTRIRFRVIDDDKDEYIYFDNIQIQYSSTPPTPTLYYVRTNGSNSNDGLSPAQSWATFAKATSSTSPGDTVYFGAGTYTEQVQPTVDGSSGSPIRFIADTDGTKTGDAGSVILNAGGGGKALELDNDEYLEFYGFTITGAGDECIKWKDSSGGVIKDCKLTNSKHGIKIDGDTDLKVVNCLIHGNSDQGLEIKSDSTVTIWNCTIADNGKKGIKAKDSSVATITNSIIANNGEDGIKREDSSSVTHTYNLVYGNSSNFDGTSQHGTEVVSDPVFVDDAGGDYHLQSASPAINAGTNASGTVDDDLDGASRPIGPSWDMGCYEYPLLGHWQFDEGSGTTVADSSGNGYDGTLEGGAGWEAARCGQAVTLDGSTDWIDLGQINLGTKAYTASVWFKTTFGSQQTIFAATAMGTNDHAFFVEIDGGLVKLTHRYPAASSGGTTVASTDLFNDGIWHQVVAVKTEADMLLYLDGELVDQTNDSTLVHSAVDVVMGREGLSLASNYFSGSIDEAILYGKALSGTEVSDLYGLVGYWKLDESSGITAFDSSNYANDGTLSGFPLWNDTGGQIDGALAFDGSNDYVTMADPGLGEGSFSVAVWVNVNDLSTANTTYGMGILRSTTGENIGDFFLSVDDGGAVHFGNWRSSGNDTNGLSYTADGTVAQSKWVHIIATWDGANNKIYINGVDVGSLSTKATATGWGTEHSIGRSLTGAGYFFDGLIDDVRIYNYALCADQAAELFGSGSGSGTSIGVRVIKWLEKK